MRLTSVVGIALIVLGVLALIYQGITWTEREQVAKLGPVEVEREERRRVPLPPVVGVAVLAAGVLLLLVGRRRPTAT